MHASIPFDPIPSVISLAHTVYTGNNSPKDDAEAKDQEAQQPTVEASEPNSPAPELTSENLCQMMAIARPDMVLVELRKPAQASPEYRELRLLNSADEAHWTPIVGNDTGRNGWLPAVNFLKIDFKPPLIDAIPDVGSCYLAYAPIVLAPTIPTRQRNSSRDLEVQWTLSPGPDKSISTLWGACRLLSPSS